MQSGGLWGKFEPCIQEDSSLRSEWKKALCNSRTFFRHEDEGVGAGKDPSLSGF